TIQGLTHRRLHCATEDDEVEIEIPSGTILTTEDGEALTGSVSVQIVSVDVTDESGLENLPGLNQPMVTESGETISLKSPLAYTSIDITDESGRKAARIVGQEMKITTTLPSGVTNPRTQKELAPGDAVPSFGFNKENAEWFFLGNEIVSEADGKLVVIKVISSMKSGTPSNFNQIVYNLEEIPTLDYLIEYTTDLSPMSMAFQYQVFGVDGAVASVGAGTISVPSGTTTSAFTIPNVQDLSDQSIGDFNLSFSSSAASFNPNPLTKGDLTSILGNPGFHVDITGNLVAPTTTDVYVKLVLECKNATVSDLPGFYVFISGTGFSGSEQIFIDQSRITLPYVHGTEPGGTWQGRLMFGDVIYPEYGDPALSLSSSAFEIIDGKVTFVYTPTTDQCTELARILGI
ncbi:MAG: hypothetical protein HOK84_09395, partial [Bacteroidetes bacterium]|nr:hypothetical protein [Bacteroidota bacterium]